MSSHRADVSTALPCPICRAEPNKPCRAADFDLLPGGHAERGESEQPTPTFDAIAHRAEALS